ncbi:MAG: S53 family peptidase, partial [Thermoplasmata archaeon]
MNWREKLNIVLIVIVSIFFLMSGLTSSAHATSPNTAPLNYNLTQISSDIGGVVNNSNVAKIGILNSADKLYVMVTLPYRNSAQLQALLAELQNKNSQNYHRYLTQQEFINEFSPNSTIYNMFVSYFKANGIQVTTYNDRVSIQLYGTVGQYEKAFHTSIYNLKSGNSEFYAPVSSLKLPYYLASNILNIVGLNDQYRAHFNLDLKPYFTGSGSNEVLYGSDLQVPYQLNKLYQKGYPTNMTVATILWGGVDSSGNQVGAFVPSDISTYFNQTLPSSEPKPTIIGYPIQGAAAPGPSAANDQTQSNYESTLDLEMVGSTAPGITVVEVYGPGSTNGGTESELDAAFADILSPPSGSPSALSKVVAISNSWGGGDTSDSTWNSYEQQAAATGITVLASSGDDGNSNGNTTPSFPATVGFDTYGSLAVGGTQATLSGTASQNGSGTTGFQTQSVWYNSPNAGDGSQGGVSSAYAEPSWQISSNDANTVITSNGSGRGTPDIAAIGANMDIWITTTSPGWQELWGTSVASPLAAGEIAEMDYYTGSNFGFIDPLVYQLGQAEVNGSYSSAPPLYFVSNGSNGAFSAENGYSLAVGWGSINAYNFILDSKGTPAPTTYTVTFTETGLASGTTWSTTFNGNTESSTSTTISYTGIADGSYSY